MLCRQLDRTSCTGLFVAEYEIGILTAVPLVCRLTLNKVALILSQSKEALYKEPILLRNSSKQFLIRFIRIQ